MMDQVERDLAKYHAELDEYDTWFEREEEELAESFWEKYGVDPEEDVKLWNKFVEARYMGRHNAN